MVKTRVLAFLFCAGSLLLTACAPSPLDPPSSGSTTDPPRPVIQSHAVYQQLNSQGRPDEFSLAMANNPITMRMDNDLARASLVTIADYQEFYSRYLSLWESELAVTLLDLNSYLSVEDAVALAAAQRQWEASVNTNLDLDQSIIESTGVELGFQYEPSVLLYLLQQYEARVYHIKYLIYLIENHVPAPDQLWDNFHHGT